MQPGADLPAWIALFTGLYALAASVGELRAPGSWMAMVEDLERSPGTRFLVGIVCMALGAAIYLAIPFQPALANNDALAVAISAIGGLAVAEGMLVLAAGDRFLALSRRMMASHTGLWAGLSALVGAALLFAALARLE